MVKHFRGSELQNFFTKVLQDEVKALIKPQYVDIIPKKVKGVVSKLIEKKADRGNVEEMYTALDLRKVLERQVEELSGGELQRFAICTVCVQKADVYMFDEPSSYLDISQRLKAARTIRSLIEQHTFIICVEHDLSILDYLSDFVCVLYGLPGAYGVVTLPYGVREGINAFLDGFIPTENLRFRQTALSFKVTDNLEEAQRHYSNSYPQMSKSRDKFQLSVQKGSFTTSEIVVLLGEVPPFSSFSFLSPLTLLSPFSSFLHLLFYLLSLLFSSFLFSSPLTLISFLFFSPLTLLSLFSSFLHLLYYLLTSFQNKKRMGQGKQPSFKCLPVCFQQTREWMFPS